MKLHNLVILIYICHLCEVSACKSRNVFSPSTKSHSTTNPTGRTTTATECTCRPHKATERSPTRTNPSTWPPPPPTATPARRSDSKPTPTTWTSTPPRGGLQTGRTSSPAPPTPGCKNKTDKHVWRLFLWVFVCGECTWVGALCGCVKGWGCMRICVHLCWNCAEWPGLGFPRAAFDYVRPHANNADKYKNHVLLPSFWPTIPSH